MSCYIVQETDGVSRFTLEDGSGFLILEDCIPVPPGGDYVLGGDKNPPLIPNSWGRTRGAVEGRPPMRSGRRRIDEEELITVILDSL